MTDQERLIEYARAHGIVRPDDLPELGVSRNVLRSLVNSGRLIRAGRGTYELDEFEVTENHTVVQAVQTQNKGVLCLASALSFHRIGTQLPHQVWLAIPKGTWVSTREDVPIRTVVMSPASYEAGIEIHRLEGIDVPVYSVAKTIADCFKFRNTVGLDVALEALREALGDRRCTRDEVRHFAKINRVDKVMRPYMEAYST